MKKRFLCILLSVCLVLTLIPISANAAAGEIWTNRASYVSSRLNGVCYGSSNFVAVGAGGTILTSPDGVNWADRTAANFSVVGGADLNAVCYGDGMFMAVGAGGKVITSMDGTFWTQKTSTGHTLTAVAYGNFTFVAVGESSSAGYLYTSTDDAASWTSHYTSTGYFLNGICYGNGQFLVVGDTNYSEAKVLTFSYGSSWQDNSSSNTSWQDLISVCYGNNLYVACDTESGILTSSDGTTSWDYQDYLSTGIGHSDANALCYGGTTYVAVGSSGTVYTSGNGITWAAKSFVTSNPLLGVCYGNGTYVAVGENGTILSSEADAAPTVTAISPTSGPATGGTTVTITGTNFTAVSAVKFGTSSAASFTVNSTTQITATSPAGSGTADVTVTTPGGTSATGTADQFTYVAAPTVTSISPASGPAAGGTTVTITGTNLTAASAVKFGTASAASFTVNSATQITATSPAGSGTADITVTTAGGTSATSTADQFTYVAAPTVTSISPASGPAAGGTTITITGTNLTAASAVKFGTSSAASFTVNSATQITATSPAGSGMAYVTVTTPGGTSATGTADQFTYVAAPAVTTGGASDISSTAATLNGTVNPNNASTTVTFEYGKTTGYGSTATAAQSPVTGTSAVDVSSSLTGLTPNTTYHYRVAGTNSSGTSNGEDKTFTTLAAMPAATTGGASDISSTAATLNGTVNPNNASTTVTFEYGKTTGYGSTATATQSPVTGTSAVDVSSSLTGLTPNTTYHYRVKSVNTAGTIYGLDATFTTLAVAPTVTGISPESGPASGGTTVTITGTAFTGATAVKFGTTSAASFTVNSDTQITATSPAGSGTADITVTTAGGTSVTGSADQFTYVAAPTVTSISPASGPVAGGTTVTITGTNLTAASAVKFGASSAASFTVNSATQITATSPAGSGMVHVSVTTAGGTSATGSADQFTYVAVPTVTSISPASGPVTGGTTVTITGTNLTSASAVKFGTASAASFTVNSDTQITATSPAGSGIAYVTVTTAGGTSATGSTDQFTYVAVPTVTGISPASGPVAGGTTVTITGTNLTAASAVKFGAASAASFTVNSATQITATSPVGSGMVHVTVTTAGGTSATGSADQFTYVAAPAATTSAASSVSSTAATLNGTVNPNSASTTVTFEYGKTTGYGSTATATQSPVTGTSATSVSCSLSGLDPNTTYHFRVVAVNAGGTATGMDQTFTTPALPVTAAVDSVAATNGTITVTLDKVPSVAPTAADFTVTSTIDGGTANSLSLSGFSWSASTKTVTFRFTPIAQAASSQSVVIAVSYNGAEPVSAAAFTVDAIPAVYDTLVSITDPEAITGIANGTAKTAAALGLPETVVMVTNNGNVNADATWDVAGCDYDESKTAEQTFTVSGTVTLPTGVVNTNNVALTAAISITVKAATGGNAPTHTIIGFLLDYTTKTVPYGTSFASLNLPDKLKAVGNEISNLWINVSDWVCSAFKPTVPGTYTFKAVLDSGYVDSGYVLDSSVSAPEIKVTVKEKETHHSSGSSSSSPTVNTDKTETKVDSAGNTATVTTKPDSVSTTGNTASIEATVPSVTVDNTPTSTNGSTVDTAKKAAVTINVPTEAIVQQLAAKKDVDLTITVPSKVVKGAVGNASVAINANKEILEAAKENLTDVTIKIKDADTQQLAYSWTFKGEDLAKSAVPVTDVNISMSVHLTTEVPKVNVITPTNKGLVLSFDHSGLLPSVASVKFSALEKGFKPGQALYFYYYNPTTKQIESLGKDAYTVDADGNVTVQISHCSDYVLLPKAARTITLDTRTYTMSPKKSYEIGVKLTGVSNTTIKAYSSTRGVANVTVLKNGNVKATGVKPGLTYIMIDVYDSKNKFLTHASVRLTVQKGVKEAGNSARQYGLF